MDYCRVQSYGSCMRFEVHPQKISELGLMITRQCRGRHISFMRGIRPVGCAASVAAGTAFRNSVCTVGPSRGCGSAVRGTRSRGFPISSIHSFACCLLDICRAAGAVKCLVLPTRHLSCSMSCEVPGRGVAMRQPQGSRGWSGRGAVVRIMTRNSTATKFLYTAC